MSRRVLGVDRGAEQLMLRHMKKIDGGLPAILARLEATYAREQFRRFMNGAPYDLISDEPTGREWAAYCIADFFAREGQVRSIEAGLKKLGYSRRRAKELIEAFQSLEGRA